MITIYCDKGKGGYNFITIKGKRCKLSRLIMAEKIGRSLSPYEIVHHKNGIRTDDRPENLEIMTPEEHSSYHCAGLRR